MVLTFVRDLRKDVTIPMVFMTYANVVYSYGAEKFISTCKEIGIDGLILPDIPYEEKEEFLPLCEKYDVDLISFIAPTSKDRIAMIAKEATGFIYVISSLGVTGTRSEIKTDLLQYKVIRENTNSACAYRFWHFNTQAGKEDGRYLDGALVASAIIKIIDEYGEASPKYVGEYVKAMKDAL